MILSVSRVFGCMVAKKNILESHGPVPRALAPGPRARGPGPGPGDPKTNDVNHFILVRPGPRS